MNQIIIDPKDIQPNGETTLTGAPAKHVCDVLKSQPGDTLRIGMLNGNRGTALVNKCTPQHVTIQCQLDQAPLPRTGLSLLLALPRPKVLKRLFAPLASLGVERIFLTNAEKVERAYFDTHWIEPSYYTPLLKLGLEQSGETFLPEIRLERRLKPLIEDHLSHITGNKYLLHPAPHATPLIRANPGKPILAALGPEGGWTDYEVDLFCQHGFTCVSLGKRILRSDIAVQTVTGILSCMMS
jgi:RsmE family RNA methyltransferase